MRLLYVISSREEAGAARYMLDLIRGFGREFEVHLAAGEEGTMAAEARDYGADFHRVSELEGASPLAVMRGCRKLAGLIGALRPSLVHAHGSRAGLMARLAARNAGVPSISTPHGWGSSLLAPLERLVSNDAGRVICVSDENRREALGRGISSARLATVRPGLADTEWRAQPGRGMVTEIVMVGPFDGRSHHQLLLEAFAGIDAPCRLALAGEGEYLPWMRGLSFKLGIAGKVRFLGAVEDTAELLARSSVLAWAGRASGMPQPVVEAMRAGLPVVASDAGLAHEAVIHGETGYLVPPNDIAGFRNALWALAADARLRTRMGDAARLRYELCFSTEQMLDKTVRLYEELSGAKGAGKERRVLAASAR